MKVRMTLKLRRRMLSFLMSSLLFFLSYCFFTIFHSNLFIISFYMLSHIIININLRFLQTISCFKGLLNLFFLIYSLLLSQQGFLHHLSLQSFHYQVLHHYFHDFLLTLVLSLSFLYPPSLLSVPFFLSLFLGLLVSFSFSYFLIIILFVSIIFHCIISIYHRSIHREREE